MRRRKSRGIIRGVLHRVVVAVGAILLTLAFFLVLPFMQTINKPLDDDLVLQTVTSGDVPPPPPPIEEQPEEEPEPEEKPQLEMKESQPLDLSQLELALNPGGVGDGWGGGDIVANLGTKVADAQAVKDIFSMADLDQRPRVIYQPSPVLNGKVRDKAPGRVYIIFIVNEQGRVESPKVQSSDGPVFEQPALAAVKQWKFEPGKRNGEAVRFRMRVPITFPKVR